MADEATPQPQIAHDIPSLPSSPLPKRTKYTEPAPLDSVACMSQGPFTPSHPAIDVTTAAPNDQPTPTPRTAALPNPLDTMVPHPTSVLPGTTAFEAPPPAMQVKLLSETARAPTRGSAFAAGYDLYAAKETTIPARGKVIVATDISIAVPAGTYGRVAPRSGLASKHSIDVGAGVIDADYRGPLGVLLFNFSETDFQVAVGERIAQLIVERVS
nr:deoxyuridine 5'-triphosphate nucleotidohydrolase [Quercus suber]